MYIYFITLPVSNNAADIDQRTINCEIAKQLIHAIFSFVLIVNNLKKLITNMFSTNTISSKIKFKKKNTHKKTIINKTIEGTSHFKRNTRTIK